MSISYAQQLRPSPASVGGLLINDQSTLATTTMKLACPAGAGNAVRLHWGDGSYDDLVCDSALKTITHDYADAGTYAISVSGDIDQITHLQCDAQSFLSGNIAAFSALTSLVLLNLSSTSVAGDIADLSTLTSLTILYLSSTSVTGDIADFSTLTSLTRLYMSSTSVTGDLADLSPLTSLVRLYLGSTGVSGDIADLSPLTSLEILNLSSTSVTGDLADLSPLTSLTYLYMYSNTLVYTTTTLPAWASATIECQSTGLDSSEVDQFLIDFETTAGAGGTLNLAGTNEARTAASDAAVTSLTNAGRPGGPWVVTVN